MRKSKQKNKKNMKKNHSLQHYNCGKKGHTKPYYPTFKKENKKFKKNQKKKKAYVAWEANDRESSDVEEEKDNLYLMTKHQDDDVTSQFFYHYLFRLCKKLMKETTKLE